MHINFCPLLLDYPFEKTLMLPAFLCRKQYDIRYLLRLAEPCGTICLWRQNSYYPVIICLCCIPPLSLFYLFICWPQLKAGRGRGGGGNLARNMAEKMDWEDPPDPVHVPGGPVMGVQSWESSHGSPVLEVQPWEPMPESPALRVLSWEIMWIMPFGHQSWESSPGSHFLGSCPRSPALGVISWSPVLGVQPLVSSSGSLAL